ncbi:MAG TPA: hypothetical protein VIH57_02275 [Bacteroidales bacterium]
MLHLLDYLLAGVFLFVAFQDFRFRAISIWTLPLIVILIVIINLQVTTARILFMNALVNILVFAIQLILVTIYFSLKHRKITNIVNRYLGLGDILFICVMGLMFSPLLFMIFLVTGLITVGLGYMLWRLMVTNTSSAIPLAGGLSLMLTLLWAGKILFHMGQVYSIPVIEHLIVR